LWRHYLSGPIGGWSVALARRCIAAYPNPERSFATEPGDGLPLVLCRRDTGAVVQRLYFPGRASELTVRFSPGAAVVVTQESGWALTPRRAVDVTEGPR
jgi:hypothetical protein